MAVWNNKTTTINRRAGLTTRTTRLFQAHFDDVVVDHSERARRVSVVDDELVEDESKRGDGARGSLCERRLHRAHAHARLHAEVNLFTSVLKFV